MARYEIIDEPHVRPWGERLIVDPTIILFAAILVPLFWNPPFMGRYWMPIAWLIVNGVALGSPTLRREVVTLTIGVLAWLSLLYGVSFAVNTGVLPMSGDIVYPYLRIILFGIFFFTLYLVVFRQAQSYELRQYLRGYEE